MFPRALLLFLLAACAAPPASASNVPPGGLATARDEPGFAAGGRPAFSGFCLFELPGDGASQRLLNLGIVQYVEVFPKELRIVYGGGNLGSGHEARIPFKSPEEAAALLQRMRQTARECK